MFSSVLKAKHRQTAVHSRRSKSNCAQSHFTLSLRRQFFLELSNVSKHFIAACLQERIAAWQCKLKCLSLARFDGLHLLLRDLGHLQLVIYFSVYLLESRSIGRASQLR